MTQLPGPEAYRSLFLEPDWAHQRYHGWHVVREEEGGRVLEKRIEPLPVANVVPCVTASCDTRRAPAASNHRGP